MKEDQLPLHLCIAGSHDFVRRFTLAAEEFDRNTSIKAIEVHPANLAELKSAVIEHRAHAVLVEIGLRLSASDAHWLKQVLSELRERFGKIITIIAAVTSPEKFVSAGNLLFADENTLTPSGLIDNFIFSP
ncbi:MAG TPA: hypothetical protein PLP17_15025, partial [Oligoflexia bacterium]|nr:hypothetical protein [Oligoflexia bacterium]